MDFSERIKQARKQLNLSQEELAKQLGVAFSTLNRWENGRFKPNYEAIQRFEEYKRESITATKHKARNLTDKKARLWAFSFG